MPENFPEQSEPDPPSATGDNPHSSEDEVDQQLCKGVHSLIPDLGHLIDGDGLCASPPWIPPGVYESKVEQEDRTEME